MDLSSVVKAREFLNEYEAFRLGEGIFVPTDIGHAIQYLNDFLATPQSDPCDECECDGCRAKTDEALPSESAREDFGPCGPLEIKPVQFTFHADQPSDYEIRLKAWESVQGFWFPDESEFDEAFAAAKKLYNFLSGQNEDVK